MIDIDNSTIVENLALALGKQAEALKTSQPAIVEAIRTPEGKAWISEEIADYIEKEEWTGRDVLYMSALFFFYLVSNGE